MGRKIKWIEDNLGITRKAIINYENHGLLPKNQDNKHREYTEDEIKGIWVIKVLQGIGFTVKEIADLSADRENIDFCDVMSKKVESLKKRKEDIEKHLKHAEYIMQSGIMEMFPKEMGSVTFSEFHAHAVDQMTINPEMEEYLNLIDIAKKVKSVVNEDENSAPCLDKNDMDLYMSFVEDMVHDAKKMTSLCGQAIFEKAICRRKDLRASSPEVQMLARCWYDFVCDTYNYFTPPAPELEGPPSIDSFVRITSAMLTSGGIASKYAQERNGEEGCRFLVDVLEEFGRLNGNNCTV